MQNYTLHTHTVGFDGRNTVLEMVRRAQELGFKTIGISNHFIVHNNIKKSRAYKYALQGGYDSIYYDSFSEATERFMNNYVVIGCARAINPDINILCGMEVDFFDDPRWQKNFHKSIKLLKPDYVIGAKHFVEHEGRILNVHDLKKADAVKQELLLKKYWHGIACAAESGLFDWMAHLDLPKKVGLGQEEKWAESENRAVEACAKSNTAIEINTSFFREYCYEPYPSNRILKMAAKHNVPVLISDDAHQVENIARHFNEAEEIIAKMNLRRFEKIK